MGGGTVVGAWGWHGQDHPPLFADEQEQKNDQARDEGQADPHNGPGVVAGPWGVGNSR